MPDFIDTLTILCKEHPFKEKWLISPNRRIGVQIMDRISLKGEGIINLHVKTMRGIIMDIASGFMVSNELTYMKPLLQEFLMGELFHDLKEKGGGYLSRLKPGSGLFQSLVSSLSELRNAGISANTLKADLFEEPAKGKDILYLLSLYENALLDKNYLDNAGILKLAIKLIESGDVFRRDILIFAPADMITHDFSPLEKRLWYSIPESQRIEIEQGDHAKNRPLPETDLSLLRMISRPFDAPAPAKDGSVDFFKAYGAVNEVREVFRRVIHGGISFDQVEIIHTDLKTYIPLIFETAYHYPLDKEAMVSVTFADGVPAKYSRPGRALSAWIYWIENDYPQTILKNMIQDGLLHIETKGTEKEIFSELAHLFRQLKIGKGKNRYKTIINNYLIMLNNKRTCLRYTEDESEEEFEKRKNRIEERYRRFEELKEFVFCLLDNVPLPGASQKEIINRAVWFIQTIARRISKLDNYATDVINIQLKECINNMEKITPYPHFNAWNWLRSLLDKMRILGMGPGEGCIYVTNIESGGYSGRPYTFIIGLDDSRFPGTGYYDPVLLDQERSDISEHLPLMADIPAKKITSIKRLFTRLNGHLTMSYSWMNIREEREMFPSQVLLSAYRIVSGNHETDQDDLATTLQSVSFVPSRSEHAVTMDEWWITKLCSEQGTLNGSEAVESMYHHLARGFTAKKMRESKYFTVFDGFVPEAGKDKNPYKEDGLILSVNMLELLARSPVDFFFRYVLCIEPPEDEEVEVNVWLDSLSRGSLLHSVFQKFMMTLRNTGELPSYNAHRELIHTILINYVQKERDINPPFHEYAYEQDLYFLKKAADIFLNREEEFCASSIPSYFEVTIGIPYEGNSSELDSKKPVCLVLSEKKAIRVRARIDRIDKTADTHSPVYAVWDYKTGRSSRYDRNEPFNKGRNVQNILYLLLAEKQLTAVVGKAASVSHFGYFFTSFPEMGQRISWPAAMLKTGKEYLITLADMIKAGCFPCSFEEKDLSYSDYKEALIDVEQTIEQVKNKIQNMENTPLAPMRRLRMEL
ncbi:MAG: PD-(D/E)XK nuclease family protein [Spirochaetales bacterium]|nr:PD-(D/E)XK nuclease family protein [Spirochaetales bacterium]